MDTIVAVSTPRGVGVRGVVRISGVDARRMVDGLFRPDPGAKTATALERGLTSGRLMLGKSRVAAAVRLLVQKGPRSFTGEDVVELHVLGAPLLLDWVQELLVREGARPAEPGEFTRRAFLSGRIDLTRAEAVHAVIAARDAEERRKALASLDGGLARRLSVVRERLLSVLVPLELGLDFSDQDVEVPLAIDATSVLERVGGDLERLGSAEGGDARRDAYALVLVGPANAGKSSLFNRLLGRDAALVSDVPGTTRDVLTGEVRHNGFRFVLVDTAGSGVDGHAADVVAHRMRAQREREADLVLEVRDARQHVPAQESAPRVLRVDTHADLLNGDRACSTADCLVSSVTGEGVAELLQLAARRLEGGAVRSSEPVLVGTRHRRALRQAADAVARAVGAVRVDAGYELIAADLRDALEAVGLVTGESASDAVLDRIFSDFCIGK